MLLVLGSHAVRVTQTQANLFAANTQESATKEQEFRNRDNLIQSQFKDAVRKKRNGELTMKHYSSTVKKLRKEELQLFSAINQHRFTDETEYNYWHRGRMKFPSVLAQEAEWLKKQQGPPPSDNLQ